MPDLGRDTDRLIRSIEQICKPEISVRLVDSRLLLVPHCDIEIPVKSNVDQLGHSLIKLADVVGDNRESDSLFPFKTRAAGFMEGELRPFAEVHELDPMFAYSVGDDAEILVWLDGPSGGIMMSATSLDDESSGRPVELSTR